MMQIVPRWKVSVFFKSRDGLVFWVDDSHLSNVLRVICGIHFSHNALEEPIGIHVEMVS